MKTHTPLTRRLSRRFLNAFSLMELMLVLAIIGLLVGAAVKYGPVALNSAKINTAKSGIGTLEALLTGKKLNSNSLKDLVAKGVLTDGQITDPWDRPYELVVPARRAAAAKKTFDLYSKGVKEEDDGDDVGNWDLEN